MNYLLGISASIGAIYVTYYYGKRAVYSYVMDKVKEELDKRLEKEETEDLFRPAEKGLSALIKVNHAGKNHNVYVPYDRSKSSSMLRKKVFLIKNGEKIELFQKPGIPYLVSAQDLGGEEIVVENLSGEIVSRYNENEIPKI